MSRSNEIQRVRRALLKSCVIGGSLALVSNVLQTRPALDLLTEVYGKPSPSLSILQTNTDAYQIITQALAAGQTKIHLPAGNYSVSKEIDVRVPNVEIFGDGQNATILRLNDNVYGGSNRNPKPAHVLNFLQADDFYVHDLQIDGNAAGNPFQGNPTTAYTMAGVHSWNSSNGTVINCLIHDCRTIGVQIEVGSNCVVQGNSIINSNANGISISNAGNHGSGHQVLNNVVNGASDVGISAWEAVGTLVQGNNVQNITLNLSPYLLNTHVGLFAEGQTPCANITFSNNTVSNISSPTTKYQGLGMSAGPDGSSNIQFLNNTFQNVWQAARFVGLVSGLEIVGNTVDGTVSLLFAPLNVSASSNGNAPIMADIEGNVFNGLPSGMAAYIVSLLAGTGKFINNTIYANGYKRTILVENPANWTTTPNTII